MNEESTTLTIRTDRDLKLKVGQILKELGLNHSTAINIFYHQVLSYEGIPFPIRIPNKTTQKALENSRNGKNLTSFDSSEDLFEDLNI